MANQINPNLLKDKVLAKQVIEYQNELEKIKLEVEARRRKGS